jgi:hypothetical protein
MQAVAALTGRKVHLADAHGNAVCGATSMYHLVPTSRPVSCTKCKAKAAA